MGTETQWLSNVRRKMDSLRLAALLAGGCLMLGCQKAGERSDYPPRVAPPVSSTQQAGEHSDYHPPVAPVVSSTQLFATEIVPTLDTPLDESGNVVWCATFQVAWNRACDDAVGGPLQITNAQFVANRLNNSPVTEAVLPSGSYFAAAGRLKDTIIETIQKEMRQQFPEVTLPDFDGATGFVTYAYLDTTATFTTPFVDTKQPIEFSDAAGVTQLVRGFGLHEGTDWDLRAKQSEQVKVLFAEADAESDGSILRSFAVDLTADHAEQQVIVAVLPRAEHLHATLDDLTAKIKRSAPNEYAEKLQETDRLVIPNVAFNLNHEFVELQGGDKIIKNPGEFLGLYILKAAQSIRFRLDKSGAAVISESHMVAGAIPRHFVVDRPFLIVMKRRSTDEPYFVAWIDNTEFLDVN